MKIVVREKMEWNEIILELIGELIDNIYMQIISHYLVKMFRE
jgi:hypothetical protein